MQTRFLIVFAQCASTCFAAVTVTNVTAVASPAAIVTITYDLASPSALTNAVGVSISTNAGATFFSTCTNFTGDVGNNVAAGTTKQILWNALKDTLPTNNYPSTSVRVWAADSMALIPAGLFAMGNCMDASEGGSAELPVHTLMVSAVYMDKHEVSYTVWTSVYLWATVNGYTLREGSGKAATHPVRKKA